MPLNYGFRITKTAKNTSQIGHVLHKVDDPLEIKNYWNRNTYILGM